MILMFSKIWSFSKNRHSALICSLICAFLKASFGAAQLLAIILTMDVLVGEAEPAPAIHWIMGLTAICVIGNFITSYIEQISAMKTGFFMVADKRVAIGSALRKIPLGFFNDNSAGKISATITTTLSGVETGAAMSMVGIISGLFNGAAFFVFILFYDWRIGLLSGMGMAAYLLVVNWQIKVSRQNTPALQKAQDKLSRAALNFFQGIKVTKAFSFMAGDAKLKEAVGGSSDANIHLTDESMPSQFAAQLTVAVFESCILLATLYLGFAAKDISVVKTIVLILFSFMVYASLNQAGSMLSMIGLLDNGLSAAEKIQQTEQLTCIEPIQQADSNEIVFEEVSFHYRENEVLHRISTTIKPQSLTAVVGPSGSGKTTLCQLILRFCDTTKGSIRIGGADLRHMEYADLMKRISMVFQKVYLFEDTLLNNIRFGKPEATLEEVRRAAEAAHCDDFIMALPDGYDTRVEEGGSSLSGGEKQRISIARAILKDAPIIILDEATSALDVENEHEILAAIGELTKNKTVIMIAHRMKSVRRADHIIALDNGQIVQEGTHEQLLEEGGLYADFITAREKASGWKLAN